MENSSVAERETEKPDRDWQPIQLPLASSFVAIKQRWRELVKWTGFCMLLSIVVAFLIPNEFTSTASFMPPDQQTFSNPSMLSALSGAGLLGAGLSGGGFLSQRTPGQTAIGILSSRTVQDELIQQFDLRSVYKVRYQYLARKKLTKNTTLVEDKKSGIISITVVDRDPKRARDIDIAYLKELDKLTNSLSTSAARRERVFLEEHIKTVKDELDKSSVALSEFSSKNATLDIQRQGQTTVESVARLQGELIALKTQLSAEQTGYTDQSPGIKMLQARIQELEAQLRSMSGGSQSTDPADLNSDQLFPTVRKLPLLGVTYYDLYRRVTILDTVYAMLSKQYELARVEEEKEIPVIRVLDYPDIPEKKSAPHRTIIVLLSTLLGATAACAWILISNARRERARNA